jgi:hypothetical protein
MDFPLIVIILAVLMLGSGRMLLRAWDNRSRRRWF